MKKILLCGLVLATSSCADFPKNIGDQMKAVNEALTPKTSNAVQTTSTRKVGTITNDQCKNSVGQTRSYFEQLVGFKLNESNSSGYTSFSETYNLKISDRKDRFGGNLAICIISIDPQSNKVTTFSMPT
ncbi:putative host cell surface-exposed lipoprotein [Pectobacterium atrosepticum SCRI1043]|uniref:Host cell surface-exposed lipoprotein n=2 Tax=Pectobacterium TaxID=122277 RepID=Q6D111_PECAS|nr:MULTISPECIES: hypothetical protein [Pectobacterium]GKV86779.1 hypothetical protein PEC301296_30900 [Pectobacterium carotovorum subsp. carotovorum]AIA72425.1 lipoprotein [Pectobacterium atrosepticum]AIK15407.1 putative host cell surface-exposed lipoprotein [Pectobacterium atrosepticum]ATY93110.1 hypothetical protein CVS35_18325 [Pectobacterium atrosepticum]KFX05381.1 lipoprotein [Pectobacterium betavasculorum]